MLRFRTVEDEKRYLALITEVYLRLGTSGIPPMVVSEILRNLAKIEAFAFYEGVRQGVAAGVLQLIHGEPTALDLHRALYGTADTPLNLKEKMHVESISLDLVNVFNDQPAEFAPLTLQEALQKYGVGLEPSQSHLVDGSSDRGKMQIKDDSMEIDEDAFVFHRGVRQGVALGLGRKIDDDDDLINQLESMLEGTEDQTPESPESLDDIRDELKRMLAGGWRPKDYPEVVLALHRTLHRDAVFIDLQLGSAVGRAVLAQVGLINLPLIPTDGSEVEIKFVETP